MNALAEFLPLLQAHAPVGKYTAARIGGSADWLYIARPDTPQAELSALIQAAWADEMPVRILGAGANVLVSDAGIRGLVIINRLQAIHWHEAEGQVWATGGTSLLTLARECLKRGMSGFEWAIGVPGTLGGASVNNAGAHGGDMARNLLSAEVLFPDGVQVWDNAALAFGYRASTLKHRPDKRFFVQACTLQFSPDSPALIQSRMDEYSLARKRSQPSGASLGSVFKNPPHDYAGRLIEACGLKGYSIGGAQVSPIHANFFVNAEDCSAQDYFALIQHVQASVHLQTGIWLELEIERVGEWA